MFEHILALASAIVQPNQDERCLLAALCAAAETELRGKLRDGVSPEACGDAFPCAAALLAAAGFQPCRSGGGDVEQFSAGDVSVRLGDGARVGETAETMRRQAARLMAPYAGDGEFAFLGVRG